MSAETWYLIAIATYAVVITVLFMIAAIGRDEDRKTIEGLRDQLKAEQQAAQFWHGVARGYHDAPGTRSSGPRNVLPFGEKGGLR